jgi:tetratricopeptide (TPR) repeat protein
MDWKTQLRRLYDDLDRLSALPTMPDFLRRYWLIVLSHLERCEHQPERLLRLCEAVLAYELWHHKAMTKLAQSPEAQMRYVVPLGLELRSGLLKLLRLLDRYQPLTAEETVVWELLRAFCHYQLGNTEQVIQSLEGAWEHGAHSPLIAFALGYNRYRWALTEFARLSPTGRQLVVTNPEAFQQALRQAITDFERGLRLPSDAATEALLHFWKGIIHEFLGERDEAQAAYERARTLDPETYSEEARQRMERLQSEATPPSPPSAELLEERHRPATPISEEELEGWRKAIMEVETVTDLLKRMGEGKPPTSEGN